MTIEFECGNCGKKLATPDSKAGKTGKCPDCGEPVTVPQPQPAGEEDDPFDFNFEDQAGTLPPRVAGRSAQSCPMCGAKVASADEACPACGEILEAGAAAGGAYSAAAAGEFSTGNKVVIGDVFSVSWKQYQDQMGIAIAAVLIAGFANMGFNMLMQLLVQGLAGEPVLQMVVLQVASALFNTWLYLGVFLFLLSIARGERAEIGQVFSGGRFFLRGIVIIFLYYLIMGVGVGIPAGLCFYLAVEADMAPVALIIGIPTAIWAIYLGLSFFWAQYVLVDRDADAIYCLKTSWELMKGNYLSVFVLNLLAGVLVFIGFLMCCVGAIFTAPLAMILQAVTYVHLTGGGPRSYR